MSKPLLGLSMMPQLQFLQATYPLFEKGKIDVLEWSFDLIQNEEDKPEWLHNILEEFSSQQRLIGHGVLFSLFDAKWTGRQKNWLELLKKEVKRYSYTHITEHFGFMSSSSENFHKGCPFPVPLNSTTLEIGIDRLKRIQDVANLPVGIENLAFAFSEQDVKEQGEFLQKLIEPINGFIILDLHNLYCQSMNFDINILDLIHLYPLDKVKEIHVSGGSWQESIYAKSGKVRRDTHDEKIPEEVFDVLPIALEKCAHCEFVIFEQLGESLNNPIDALEFQNDYYRLQEIISKTKASFQKQSWGKEIILNAPPVEDLLLDEEQKLLCKTLLETKDCHSIKDNLKLQNWNIENWDLSMIDTAIRLSEKWS